jgi:hypothetical protein
LFGGTLEMDLWVTPTGTARAEEVLEALGLNDLPSSGAVLERTKLELQDESLPQDSVPTSLPDSKQESGEGMGMNRNQRQVPA